MNLRRWESPRDTARIAALSADQAPTAIIGCPPDLVEVRRVFSEPIGGAEKIARATGKLICQLCKALKAKGLGTRRLDLLFYRVDNRFEGIVTLSK
jgi:coenzyme F420-reducing hydrogenase gamma subunit